MLRKEKYEWERSDYNEAEDPFLQHFDENGNFIEKLPEEDTSEAEMHPLEIKYHYYETKRNPSSGEKA